MAEQKSSGIDQQTLMYVLIGVVVVLVAVVGFMVYQRSQPSGVLPAGGVGSAAQINGVNAATGQSSQATTPAGMVAPPSVPVDPKTSTKVDGTPKAHVEKYYAAAVKGDWKTAYTLLPAANKGQSTEEQFAQTQQGYGINSFKVTGATESGDQATVTVSMNTQSFGAFSNQWTFQKVNGEWYVAGKKTMMGGTGQ